MNYQLMDLQGTCLDTNGHYIEHLWTFCGCWWAGYGCRCTIPPMPVDGVEASIYLRRRHIRPISVRLFSGRGKKTFDLPWILLAGVVWCLPNAKPLPVHDPSWSFAFFSLEIPIMVLISNALVLSLRMVHWCFISGWLEVQIVQLQWWKSFSFSTLQFQYGQRLHVKFWLKLWMLKVTLA